LTSLLRANVILLNAMFWAISHPGMAADFKKIPAVEARGSDTITIHGDLFLGDEKKFIDVAISSTDALVVFHSHGGNLHAGMEIGKAIRLKGFSTLVPEKNLCASACALAWLGGRIRLMSETARVGFHAASSRKDGESNISSSANAVVGAYLNQIGLPTSAVVYITSAPPEGMQWLNLGDALRVGIDVKQSSVATLVEERTVTATKDPDSAIAAIRIETSALVNAINRSNADSLAYLESKYTDQVDYLGKLQSKAAVLADKQRFFQKWPERRFSIKADSLKVACSSQNRCASQVIVNRKALGALLNLADSATYIFVWTIDRENWKLAAESWR
jgi:hypothetical protein